MLYPETDPESYIHPYPQTHPRLVYEDKHAARALARTTTPRFRPRVKSVSMSPPANKRAAQALLKTVKNKRAARALLKTPTPTGLPLSSKLETNEPVTAKF